MSHFMTHCITRLYYIDIHYVERGQRNVQLKYNKAKRREAKSQTPSIHASVFPTQIPNSEEEFKGSAEGEEEGVSGKTKVMIRCSQITVGVEWKSKWGICKCGQEQMVCRVHFKHSKPELRNLASGGQVNPNEISVFQMLLIQ